MHVRPLNRALGDLRPVSLQTKISRYAEGSCLMRIGHTQILCTATVEDRVPRFLRGKNKGWVTAEYGMLPRATHSRTNREAYEGRQNGRTIEIQRLIGRSLRAAVDLDLLGERQIIIDCDVLQADGGTRTAAITAGYVALHEAVNSLLSRRVISTSPLLGHVAAISCGIVSGTNVVDLEYEEDSRADLDCNIVMNENGGLIEIQGTAEQTPCSRTAMNGLLDLADKGIRELISMQKEVLQS